MQSNRRWQLSEKLQTVGTVKSSKIMTVEHDAVMTHM
jgi:hypothetical protein